MKAAIFTNNFFPRVSGVSVAVGFLVKALQSQGIDTMVIAPEYGFGEEIKDVRVHRVTSVPITIKKVSLPLAFLDYPVIEEEVSKYGPELIHIHHPFWLGKAGMDLADELRVPLVYTFHTLYEFFTHYLLLDTQAVRQAIKDYMVKFTNRCDLVIAPTAPIRDYLKEIGVTTHVEAVPTGVDFSRFDMVTQEDLERKRKEYGLEQFDGVLLYVGRIAKEKNVALLIEALALLRKRDYNLALVMAGDGPEVKPLQRDAQRFHIKDNIIWTGFLDQMDLAKIYLLGDLFLFPSNSDTQGIVLYEARAAGLPIVAADSMASRAIVDHGKNGLFAELSPEDFADRIIKIINHPDEFAAPFDRSAFSHESLGITYKRLYLEMINRGRRKTEPAEEGLIKGIFADLKEIL